MTPQKTKSNDVEPEHFSVGMVMLFMSVMTAAMLALFSMTWL